MVFVMVKSRYETYLIPGGRGEGRSVSPCYWICLISKSISDPGIIGPGFGFLRGAALEDTGGR